MPTDSSKSKTSQLQNPSAKTSLYSECTANFPAGGTHRDRIIGLVEQLFQELSAELHIDPSQLLCGTSKDSDLAARSPASLLTVRELCDQYLEFARSYYRKIGGGEPHEATSIGHAIKPLRRRFGKIAAADFGPKSLKVLREVMIAKGWCRNHVNMQVGRIKRMYKWAVSNELLHPMAFHALESVAGLRAGRSRAAESKPVKPVPENMIEAVLPHVAAPVKAMIELQLLTGMRPGEVTIMRLCDIDRTSSPWLFRPEHHKTEQHGHERSVFLGPKAQDILRPYICEAKPSAYFFSPRQSDKERRQKLHQQRKTPMSCGNKPGSNRRDHPKRKPGDRYDTQAYGHAVRYGCRAAFPPPEGLSAKANEEWRQSHNWHPHQLRHNAATTLRKEFGLDVAQVVLGHKTLAVTQVYAEKDVEAAAKVMQNVG